MVPTLRLETISTRLLIIGLATLIVFVPAQLKAQVTGATLSGSVTDVSGAVIPGARVSIKNTATGVIRNVTANSAGFYNAPNLLPGTYQVTGSASGFNTVVRTGITLTVGAEQVLNLTLQVGKITQTVQVTGQAPALQLATSSMSAVVGGAAIVQLPLNGRSWTDLASLQPGVAPVETQNPISSSSRGNRGFGAQIAISGSRPQQNNYRLDGISINDYANGGPGSVLGGNLGVDAVQEFSVITIDPSAEYGKTAGGVVNAITRSGTNSF
ncbi:MAG: carboxypeptidase regulatory-like domain-containing protein, partial [Terriglobia bacterium]